MKRMTKLAFVCVSMLIMALCAWRIIALNGAYPSPSVHAAHMGDTLTVGNYEWSIKQVEWHDGHRIKKLLPLYTILYDKNNNEYPLDDERIAYVELSVKKNAQDDTFLDLTAISFENQAWHNQFDPMIFAELNPDNKGLFLELDVGKSANLIFPVVLIKDNFTPAQWQKIADEGMAINTVLSCYPQKNILVGKRAE